MEEKSKKQNLILISPMLHQGGFERVCVTTARLLEDYFDVTIVIFDDSDIAYDISGLKIVNLNLGAKDGKINKILNLLKRIMQLKKIKRELSPIASYSFGATANIANSLSKVKGVPTWCGIRSYMDMLRPKEVRFIIDRSDMVVSCSKDIEDELNNGYNYHKTFTLYNPYDADEILKESLCEAYLPWNETVIDRNGNEALVINIISMGREDEVKGYWHLIKAFKRLNERLDNTRLIFIGDGDFTAYMGLCEALGIRDKVYFAGLQTNPYKYLRLGSLYALTSINEGFPNALVEGMLLGMAAIATDCKTGPSEILEGGKYGVLMPVFSGLPDFNPDNITSEEEIFADRMYEMLSDEEGLRTYRELAKKRACEFTSVAYVNRLCGYLKGELHE